ncbi:DUF1178 family protein [Candidatus Pelagibacter communis]|uniref:DUF1178 family protein n=1 Tax=Pelagibacter ubique TaxID=198252 RepID=UPI00094BF121|nr:DUF1178 family protein [Candidatus Pelagibacter ubique]|tara:strand:- start:702 stop:1130 length:429 start_codon:yes stop_codon:yes gene_type:complete
MIKYSLICKDCDLIFESWFASSGEYEKLKKKKLLNCHKCESFNIDKNLMAPSLINKKQDFKINKDLKKYEKIKKTISEYQKFIKNNFEYVGDNFAYEARSIHYNEKKKKKGIYGTASKNDLKELKEEGIDAQIIPWVEDNKN